MAGMNRNGPGRAEGRQDTLNRRQMLGGMGSCAIAPTAFSQDYDSLDDLPDAQSATPSDLIGTIRAPSLKPRRLSDLRVRWRRVADLPIAAQEIYPAPFWTDRGQGRSSKALARDAFNVIVTAGGITGGTGGRYQATDRTFIYDAVADRWTEGDHLPQPRHHLHLVAHNGFLYAMGGFTTAGAREAGSGWRMVPDLFRLDDPYGRWKSMRPMPGPQAEAAVLSNGGFIHIIGGRAPAGSFNERWQDHIDTDRHWIYDSRTDEWYERAPISLSRNSMAAVTHRGVIYLFGGRRVSGGNLAMTEAYDPLADRWQTMRPMPRAQAGLAAAILGATAFVFGGEYFGDRGGGVYSEVWAYDLDEDRWRSAGRMPYPRHGLGAVTLNRAIYVIGGALEPGGDGTTPLVHKFEIY